MRLQQYINETTELTEEEVEEILDIGFNRYEDWLSKTKFKFWPLIWLNLNIAFQTLDISFIPNWGMKETEGFTFIKNSKITIVLERGDLKLLKTFGGIEKFRKKHQRTFYHELIHRKQYNKMSKKFREKEAPLKYGFNKKDSMLKYLSGDTEIEAFAREAVADIKNNGKFEIIRMYYEYVKGIDNKVWHKFLKKLYIYLEDVNPLFKKVVRDKLKVWRNAKF